MPDLQTVIGNLYDSVMDESAFHPVIESCGRLIGRHHGLLFSWSGRAADMPEVVSYFTPDSELIRQFLTGYADYYHLLDPTKDRWYTAAEGDWLVDSRERAPDVWRNKPFYQDFVRTLGVGGWAALKVAAADRAMGSPEWALSLLRDDGTPDFSPENLSVLGQVAPHLRRTLMLRQRYAELRKVAAMGLGVLDLFAMPVWVAEWDGRLRHANAAAEAVMRGPAFPVRQAKERFVFAAPRDQSVWDMLFRPDADNVHGSALKIPSRDGSSIILQILPLPVGLTQTGSMERPMRLIVAHMPGAADPTPGWRQILVGLYGYTPAEIAIAFDLARDRTAVEIAELRGSLVDTVRSQIKSMLHKAGCRRQAELVRLLDRLGLFAGDARA